MAETDPVIIKLIAETQQAKAELKATTRVVRAELGVQGKSIAALERQFKASSSNIGSSMKAMAVSIAGALSVRELMNYADSFTRVQNALKVAGLEGQNLAQVQGQLLEQSGRYGVSLESLSSLFGNATQAGQELGASQQQIVGLTEATAQALLITGTSATQASGAILGLTQALSSEIVRAEEFNQINEGGLRPLLQAAANSERFGGSVAKLRAAMLDGKVTSQEFFNLILQGADGLEKQAARATLTLSAAFTSLYSQLTVYMGEADKSAGASAAMATAIQKIGDNLDTIIPALAAIAVGMGVYAVAANGATVATGALTGALSILAAHPVAIAVAALAGGLSYLAIQQASARAEAEAFNKRMEEQAKALTDASKASGDLAGGQSRLQTSVASLTGEVGLLAQEWAKVAANAKQAAIEQAYAAQQAAMADMRTAQAQFAAAQEREFQRQRRSGNPTGGIGGDLRAANARLAGSDEVKALQNATTVLNARNRELQSVMSRGLGEFRPGTTAAAESEADKKKRLAAEKKAAAAAQSAAREAEQAAQEALQRRQEERSNAIEVLRAQAGLTEDISERAALEQEMLALERAQRQDDLNSRRDLTDKERIARQNAIDALYGTPDPTGQTTGTPGLLGRQINRDEIERLNRERLDIEQAQIDNARDLLSADADLADTREERRAIEMQLLDLAYEQERAELEAVQASLTATQAQKDIAAARLAILGQLEARDRERVNRDNESPLERRRREVRETAANIDDAVEDIQLGAIDRLTDGLADASTEFIKLGGIAGDVLNSIIRDMVRLAAQQAIFGNSGGGGGLIGSIGGMLGFATGGYTGDGPVNEPAGIVHKGEYVIPANAVKRIGVQNLAALANGNIAAAAAMTGVSAVRPAAAAGGGTIKVQIMMDNDVFTARVQEASAPVAVEVVRQSSGGIVQAASAETIRQMNRPRMG